MISVPGIRALGIGAAGLAVVLAITLAHAVPVNDVTIVVTFPSLRYDIEQLACPGDTVYSLVPSGVDPHEYELTLGDVELLLRADLVISTSHFPIEVAIKAMAEHGELKATLLEMPGVEGVRILVNPITGQPNYHMPIYDPDNYLAFMRAVAKELVILNSPCASWYEARLKELTERVKALMEEAPRMNAVALAPSPLAQYAVEWLGIKIKYLIAREHGAPIAYGDLSRAREAASRGAIDLAILVGNFSTPLNEKVGEIAREHGIPVIVVPSPMEPGSTLEKLETVVNQIKDLVQGPEARELRHTPNGREWWRSWLPLALIVATALTALLLIRLSLRKPGYYL